MQELEAEQLAVVKVAAAPVKKIKRRLTTIGKHLKKLSEGKSKGKGRGKGKGALPTSSCSPVEPAFG